MASTRSPIVPTFQRSPARSLMNKLIGRSSGTLPRKLASSPFAASLLSALSPDEKLHRRLQLQRIVDVVVLDATRDKKKQLVITLKLSLKPEAPREQVGIFVPSNAAVAQEITMTFHDVNQLRRALEFCVDSSTRDCDDNCDVCSQLRTYLSTHWVRDPLVAVVSMGETVLRKASLARHLAQLVAFATRKSLAAPRVAVMTKPKTGVAQLVPQLSPLRKPQTTEIATNAPVCAAQNAVAAVLYDFFRGFAYSSKTLASSTTKEL
ncbi:hypothetical protein PHYPSEUDO_008247 [Phytophthora pseudosyringae]|uniref:Uncharacterized protein n=1 Tax=Phytophthora pseudosyringae TaxID=221518 RepID=A0A8T1VHT7_9STRA|nr:hypothetical protein PHYPSEUDO_008247 [Phytophthora pseudosyringae]